MSSPRRPPRAVLLLAVSFITLAISAAVRAQEDYDYDEKVNPPPAAQDRCIGVFLTYTFISRTKEYPHVKNASAQSYAFKSTAAVLNTMTTDLPAWNMFIGFQHHEILVSASGAVITDGTDFPVNVENGTSLSGFPQTDLMNAIDTAGDLSQIRVEMHFTGTQFGVKPPGTPMPRTIKLLNDGYKCPAPTKKGKTCFTAEQ